MTPSRLETIRLSSRGRPLRHGVRPWWLTRPIHAVANDFDFDTDLDVDIHPQPPLIPSSSPAPSKARNLAASSDRRSKKRAASNVVTPAPVPAVATPCARASPCGTRVAPARSGVRVDEADDDHFAPPSLVRANPVHHEVLLHGLTVTTVPAAPQTPAGAGAGADGDRTQDTADAEAETGRGDVTASSSGLVHCIACLTLSPRTPRPAACSTCGSGTLKRRLSIRATASHSQSSDNDSSCPGSARLQKASRTATRRTPVAARDANQSRPAVNAAGTYDSGHAGDDDDDINFVQHYRRRRIAIKDASHLVRKLSFS